MALFVTLDVHEALVHDADVHEALVHEADVHEALVHDAVDQEALVHDADVQEAVDHDASAFAALVQLAASNTGSPPPVESDTRNALRAAFGFGGVVTAAAACARTAPTPTESGAEPVSGAAETMSAPFT